MTGDSLTRVRLLEAQGEQAYARLYDAVSPGAAAACYADAKDCFTDALAMARRLFAVEDIARLQSRLDHVKAVFRSQFS